MKKYKCIEKNCNNNICYANFLYGNKRCRKCAAIVRGRPKNLTFKNKKHNKKVKDKISEANKGKKFSEKHLKNLSEAHKGYKMPEKYKEIRRQKSSGRNNGMFGKPCPQSKRVYYKKISFRSSWEAKYAEYLDNKNIIWIYEPKRFYMEDLTYCPDFYLPKINTYIEIKGFYRKKAKLRIQRFKEYFPKKKLIVLHEKELKELGVLNV